MKKPEINIERNPQCNDKMQTALEEGYHIR